MAHKSLKRQSIVILNTLPTSKEQITTLHLLKKIRDDRIKCHQICKTAQIWANMFHAIVSLVSSVLIKIATIIRCRIITLIPIFISILHHKANLILVFVLVNLKCRCGTVKITLHRLIHVLAMVNASMLNANNPAAIHQNSSSCTDIHTMEILARMLTSILVAIAAPREFLVHATKDLCLLCSIKPMKRCLQ